MIYQKVLFSKDECNRILNEHNTFVKSKIVHNSSLYKEDNLIRTSNESTIPLSFELKTLLLNKLSFLGINSLPNYNKVLRYEKGQEFKKHQDTGSDSITIKRYKTLIIQLSDEIEYEGGELIIWDTNEIIADKHIGNFIMFDSSSYHQAKPILDGIRYVFVMWLEKQNLNNQKSHLI